MWLKLELNQVKDLFLVLPNGEDNELKGFSWYRFGNSWNYRDLQSMRVQGSHSRKSLPSQQLLTTSVSLREKKRKGSLCLLSACISGGTVRRPSLWRHSCVWSWLLLNFRSAMMTSSLTCLQSPPDGGSSGTPGVSSTQLGLKLPNSRCWHFPYLVPLSFAVK